MYHLNTLHLLKIRGVNERAAGGASNKPPKML